MKGVKLFVKGLHCKSCEVLIEKILKEKFSFKNISISRIKNTVTFDTNNDLSFDFERINSEFNRLGYIFSDAPFNYNTNNINDYIKPIVISMFVVLIVMWANKLFFANYSLLSPGSSLVAFLVIGIVAGFSSCGALVGSIVLTMSKFLSKNTSKSYVDFVYPHILFNLGRLVSFVLLGMLLGFVGESIQISSSLSLVLWMVA